MDLIQAEAFLAVATELHFGRAAQSLGMSQPPLSRTIRQLENRIGVALFVRSTRSVQLTSAGAALIPHARRMLDARAAALDAVRRAANGSLGRVLVGFSVVSSQVWIGGLASAVRKSYPNIELVFDSAAFAERSIGAVERGELDLAMLRSEFPPERLSSRVIDREPFVVALPSTHALAGQERVRLADLRDDAFVALPPLRGMVTRNVLERTAHANGFEPRFVQTAPDSWTLMTLVAAEVGCSFTLESVAKSFSSPRVVFKELEDPIPEIEMRIIWNPDNGNPALHRVLEVAATISLGGTAIHAMAE